MTCMFTVFAQTAYYVPILIAHAYIYIYIYIYIYVGCVVCHHLLFDAL